MLHILILLAIILSVGKTDKPNFIFILTDDQTEVLGDMEAMPITRRYLGEQGMTFTNAFVSTPLCCPSRASILTGRYIHNHKVVNNTISGNCNAKEWVKTAEKDTVATHLAAAGYTNFFAGKYLNFHVKGVGKRRVTDVPPGWDYFYFMSGPQYYGYKLFLNRKGQEVESVEHHNRQPKDYSTDVLTEKALNFLQEQANMKQPFFMMLAPIACHSDYTPAQKYNKAEFKDTRIPRTLNFNNVSSNWDKHWFMKQRSKQLPHTDTQDKFFLKRLQALLSVDEMIGNIINELESQNILDNTYILFSSDNGYHLGHFGLPAEKRQPYEVDIRVPLLIRGPGILAGRTSQAAVLSTDFAPTLIELAGQLAPPEMDGVSFVPLLKEPQKPWRSSFLIEYQGEGLATVAELEAKCVTYAKKAANNGDRNLDNLIRRCHNTCTRYGKGGTLSCGPNFVDSWNNTYTCVRKLNKDENTKFCSFYEETDRNGNRKPFFEMYDLSKDPFEMKNLATDPKYISQVKENLEELKEMQTCRGETCWMMPEEVKI